MDRLSERSALFLGWGGFVAIVLAVLALWAVLAASASADVTVSVNTPIDETTSGDGACSLREAILYADGTAEPDCALGTASGTTTIDLPAGRYELASTELQITGNAAIEGAGASSTTIDANGTALAPRQVLDVGAGATVSISGVAVTGGFTPLVGLVSPHLTGGNGAGIENAGTLTLSGVTVTGNHTQAGTINTTCSAKCSGGSGGWGGGIWNLAAATLTIEDSMISANTTGAGRGGTVGAGSGTGTGGPGGNGGTGGSGAGIYNQGKLTVTDSTISGNSTGVGGDSGPGGSGEAIGVPGGIGGSAGAGGSGGGIENTGTLTITGSTIVGNSAGTGGAGGAGGPGDDARGGEGAPGGAGGSGGGIDGSTAMTVENSTITGNSTGAGGAGGAGGSGVPTGTANLNGPGGSGGGLNQSAMAATLSQLTIDANTSAGTGVGGGIDASGGTISVANSIVASNHASAAANCAGAMIADAGHNLSFGDSSCPGTKADPKLGALSNNGGPTLTMALAPGSPAVDLVPTRDCPLSTDQRGVSRPQGAACDAGAYELAPPTVTGVAGRAKTATTATVTASVSPNLKPTTVTVDYGRTISYGSASASQHLGAGNGPARFTANLTHLAPSHTYHARVVATNSDGTRNSRDITFKTPSAVSLVSASVTGDRVSLRIACNPGPPTSKCAGSITLTSHVTRRSSKTIAVAATAGATSKPPRKKTTKVKLASRSYSVASDGRVTIKLTLNATGRKLLRQFHRLPCTIMIGGTGSITKRITFT